MEPNPGTFFCRVERLKPEPVDDDVEIRLSLGDARRLHHILTNGLPNNPNNSIWGLRERLLKEFLLIDVDCIDLG